MTVGELKEFLKSYPDDSIEIYIGERNEYIEEYDIYEIDFAIENDVIDWRNGFMEKMKIHDGTFFLVKGRRVGSNMLE